MKHNRLDDLSKDELVYLIDQFIHHERNRKIAYQSDRRAVKSIDL